MKSTISAISTPFGRGGIAVIRISGEEAIGVAERVFRPKNGKHFSSLASNVAVYGDILKDGEVIDNGVAVLFRSPNSYTGEDVVELSCHGGILITDKVLRATLQAGARMATAGEFTQRAFVNGKIDLSEAEAVIGLIDAESDEKLRLCASHLNGVLKRKTDEIYTDIGRLVSSLYVCIDYPEEGLEELSESEIRLGLGELLAELRRLESTYREGRAVSEGIDTVIVGKPNSGKSSLLNALLEKDRAIVTNIAGTTRDTIEERLTVGGVTLHLCDTAGVRNSNDEIERIGIERSLQKLSSAALVLAVFDRSSPLDSDDFRLISEISRQKETNPDLEIVCILNKCDLDSALDTSRLEEVFGSENILEISAKCGHGVPSLKEFVKNLYINGAIDYSKNAVLANARQFAAVESARRHTENAISALESGLGTDICGLNLELAMSELGNLDGRSIAAEITDLIFHNFCVGK